jgi:[acyl-carrier-protein] S-malonyltransferase
MSASDPRVCAVLFPGQGSQEKGMGRDLAEREADCLDLWKRAEKASGLPLREIYWDGEEADMARTDALQPAMTAVNLSLWLRAGKHLAPAGVAGHSLGEFSALAAAGVLSLDDTLALTSLRGKLMSQAGGPDQGMTAVLKLALDKVEEIAAAAADKTGTLCIAANRNTPAQFVLSGHKAALEAAAELVKEAKGRAVPLAVSGAFHSPLVSEAAAELAKAMGKMDWSAPRIPVVLNVTAAPEPDPAKVQEAMTRQMVSPVRWIETMASLWGLGARRFVELGPKGVLSRMCSPNLSPLGAAEGEWSAESAATLEAADALF